VIVPAKRPAPRPAFATIGGEPLPFREAESPGFDLTAMRVQLIESETAATEIATTLETAIAEGFGDPLALRVLGEAYLRLGRTEQAAAQFRQAMLARCRVR
jgi:cytochrome c-type biogenesis protein CcmH/NrfG